MFERFTERARKVVVLAQEEARHFNHNYIGTEHLLLGLLREDEGVAVRALSSLNVTLDEVREQVESIVGYGEEGTGGQAPFTPRSKKVLEFVQRVVGYGDVKSSGSKAPFTPRSKTVLELALREALQFGHNYIGTEHLLLGLLGLVQRGEGVAALALSNLDVDPDEVRREVVRILGGRRAGRPAYGYSNELYRARVTKIQVEARFGLSEERMRPRRLELDLEYTHGQLDTDSAGADPYSVADEAARLLEAQPFRTLAEGVDLVGLNLPASVPEIGQVIVTLSGPRTLSGRDGSTASVSATFPR